MSNREDQDMPLETRSGDRRRTENTIIDANTQQEIPAAKKARIEPNRPLRRKVLKFIAYVFYEICILINKNHPPLTNFSIGMQITNIMFTMHTILRQEAGGFEGNAARKSGQDGQFELTSLNEKTSLSKESVKTLMKKKASELNLESKKWAKDDQGNWYGIVAPYLNFHLGFGLRYRELRMGHTTMPIRKDKGKLQSLNISQYGLDGSHHTLLEGCTFPPEKRSSMAQSVGPMTALLCHIRSPDLYRQKWTNAAKRAMAHIPHIDDILNVTKGASSATVKVLVRTTGDILNMTTSRQAQRMFFRTNFIAVFIKAAKQRDGSYIVGDTRLTEEQMKAWFENFNVSGRGGYFTSKVCSDIQ